MSRAEFEDLIALHALGALERDEAARLEAHLRTGCEECNALMAESLRAAAALSLAAPPVSPPAGARERLLQRARTEPRTGDARRDVPRETPRAAPQDAPPLAPPEAPREAPRSPFRFLAPAALITALAAMLFLGVQLSQFRKLASERERLIELLISPKTPRIELKDRETIVANALYDADRRVALVFASNMPEPAEGKKHVLWILPRGGAPRNVGAFTPHDDIGGAHVIHDVPSFWDIDGIALSEESDPNTPTPTKVVAAGKI